MITYELDHCESSEAYQVCAISSVILAQAGRLKELNTYLIQGRLLACVAVVDPGRILRNIREFCMTGCGFYFFLLVNWRDLNTTFLVFL